jgi:hypothetical protein
LTPRGVRAVIVVGWAWQIHAPVSSPAASGRRGRRTTHRFAAFAAVVVVTAVWFAPVPRDAGRAAGAPAPTPQPVGAVLNPHSLAANVPFAMPAVALPRIPVLTVRITDHGARGDGATLNTGAIAAAIDASAKAGGGRVVVPRGLFLTGPVDLKSTRLIAAER